MLIYSGQKLACFEHSNLFKVIGPPPPTTQLRAEDSDRHYEEFVIADVLFERHHYCAPQKSNYELFNCNNFNIRYWSWNYRGCWHQTCPPIVPR